MRRALLASSLAIVTFVLGACSSWGGEAEIYTYNVRQGGGISASDGIGSGMTRGTATTAYVPDQD